MSPYQLPSYTRILICLGLLVWGGSALADNPLKKLTGQSDSLPRLPDDQIEGTVWEYYGTLKPTKSSAAKPAASNKAAAKETPAKEPASKDLPKFLPKDAPKKGGPEGKEPGKSAPEAPSDEDGPLPRAEVDANEETPLLEGQFRTEGKAIFDISTRFRLPDRKKVEEVVEAAKKGKLKDIKLPSAPQQKRIGEYREIQGNKLRLDFNDKEGLHGLMIIWRKKNTEDVWIGTFAEKQGTKTIRQWNVELRPIED